VKSWWCDRPVRQRISVFCSPVGHRTRREAELRRGAERLVSSLWSGLLTVSPWRRAQVIFFFKKNSNFEIFIYQMVHTSRNRVARAPIASSVHPIRKVRRPTATGCSHGGSAGAACAIAKEGRNAAAVVVPMTRASAVSLKANKGSMESSLPLLGRLVLRAASPIGFSAQVEFRPIPLHMLLLLAWSNRGPLEGTRAHIACYYGNGQANRRDSHVNGLTDPEVRLRDFPHTY
jgi:hypothetical protein